MPPRSTPLTVVPFAITSSRLASHTHRAPTPMNRTRTRADTRMKVGWRTGETGRGRGGSLETLCALQQEVQSPARSCPRVGGLTSQENTVNSGQNLLATLVRGLHLAQSRDVTRF